MKTLQRVFLLLLFSIISTAGIYAQKTVTGTVVDKSQQPVPGVNILVTGTSQGTTTDYAGKYSLSVPQGARTLTFSFVGMEPQVISIGTLTQINVTMAESAIGLGEVVVVGFGTQKKENLTGAVSSVSASELAKRPVTDPTLMLQGKVPGIQIVQNSGQPGAEAASIQIRGRRSFGTGNEPLILVDGVQGSLSQLNPDMIESISVLKDASASAIYGSRAANGVILVTTKRGTANNRLNIEFNTRYSVDSPTFIPELVTNSVEYMTLLNEAAVNSRGVGRELYTQADIDAYKNANGNPMYPNTDWNDLVYRNGSTKYNYLSLNGGNETTNYNLGLSYVDQTGVIQHYDSKKYNVLFNMTSKTQQNCNAEYQL